MKRFATLLLAALSISFASEDSLETEKPLDAPLGLKWGMKISEVSCTPLSQEANLTVCDIKSPPKKMADAFSYMLVFDEDEGLQKIMILTDDIEGDVYGFKGKEAYDKYKKALQRKYGKPTSTYEYTGQKLYDQADEFYECLRYTGCGSYTAFYEKAGTVVLLALKGDRRGSGYINIAIESPRWEIIMKRAEYKERKQAEDAL
jgi:hypothetical protein